MKAILMLILCMMVSFITNGQAGKNKLSDEIEGISISPPRFIGDELNVTDTKTRGHVELNNYLSENLQYPEKSKRWNEEGTEVIQFVVTSTGRLMDFHVLNSISPEIDQEVIRVLKTTDRMWNPGLNNGKPVDMENEISMAFRLNEVSGFMHQAKHFYTKGSKKLFIKGDVKSALRCYNKVVQYMPYDKSSLLTRGICKFEIGDKDGACQDWNRVKSLGGSIGDGYLKDLCEFKGYAEMVKTLNE